MASSLKTYSEQANYREIAGLWLGLGTVVGLLELALAAMASLWVLVMFRAGAMGLAEFVVTIVFFSSVILAPVAGWALFSRSRYWAAIVLGGYPVVLAAIALLNFARP